MIVNIILICFYVLGVLFSASRHLAIENEWYEDIFGLHGVKAVDKPSMVRFLTDKDILFHLLSWIMFVILLGIYYSEKNKYLFKTSFKSLKKKYNIK